MLNFEGVDNSKAFGKIKMDEYIVFGLHKSHKDEPVV